jgi:hypothetical protein
VSAAEDLSKVVREFLAAQGSQAKISGPTQAGSLVIEQGLLTHFLGLKNLGARYREAQGGAKNLWLERMLVALRPIPKGPRKERVAGRLLPRLRTEIAIEQQRTERGIVEQMHGLAAPDMLLAHRSWKGGLALLLAYEMAEEAVDVAEVHLQSWGLARDEAFELALQSLRSRPPPKPLEVAAGLFASTAADGFDAARILLPELWADLKVKGKLVAMSPHQDALFLTGSDDEEALEHVASLALDLGQQPLGISAQTFILEGKEWKPWSPEPARRSARALELARLPEIARAYERQKTLLEAQAELERREETISPFVVLRDDEKQLVSATVWIEGTEPLLAKAERIAFAAKPKPGEEESLRAVALPWDEALAIPGVSVERTKDVPERYRARGFPPMNLIEAED